MLSLLLSRNYALELGQLTEEPSSSRQTDLVFVKSSADDTKVSIPGVERPWLSKAEGFNLPKHDTGRILSTESQLKVTDSSVIVTDYDSIDESSVCSTPLHPLEKLVGPAKGYKNVSASKRNSAPTGKLKNVKNEDNFFHLKYQGGSSSRSQTSRPLKPFPPCKHCGFKDHQSDDCVNYPTCEIFRSNDHDTKGHNRIVSLRRGIKPKNPQQVTKSCETYGSNVHTATDHNDIECVTSGSPSGTWTVDAQGFDKKKRIIFSSNKKVVMIASRVRDVYVLDMASSVQQFCFFAKASESLNLLWNNRLAHLHIKTINQLANQNLVLGLPSLVYSKDKPFPSCE
ncbi:retrovirus-related pol polyprotein from transposon TNT 1-94 [Tanacetum coccineum]|uniref:Retrovirus-related pol polyprotein from transposon TNT 1-94 n=1 Tax=Tanacetum coccineum TaxID=301880 RepID=A0ABQ5CI81_9ASTR